MIEYRGQGDEVLDWLLDFLVTQASFSNNGRALELQMSLFHGI